MSDLLVADSFSNKLRPAWVVEAADNLIWKVRNKDIWESIDFLLEVWKRKNPQEAARFGDAVRDTTSSRRNEHASSETKSLRYLLELPQEIHAALDFFFAEKINEMGKNNFFREFARRYPFFKVAERI